MAYQERLILQSKESRTIDGLLVPVLTGEQVIKAHNAILNGMSCFITDADCSIILEVINGTLDTSTYFCSIYVNYINGAIVTYYEDGDINVKNVVVSSILSSPSDSHIPTEKAVKDYADYIKTFSQKQLNPNAPVNTTPLDLVTSFCTSIVSNQGFATYVGANSWSNHSNGYAIFAFAPKYGNTQNLRIVGTLYDYPNGVYHFLDMYAASTGTHTIKMTAIQSWV